MHHVIVFIKKKLVILAMAKTGSTAIEAALTPFADAIFRNPPGLKHTNMRRFERLHRKAFESHSDGPLEIACLMREPIDWLASWYRYRNREKLKGTARSTENVTFDAFVQGYMQGTRPEFAKVGDQATFIAPPAGSKGVTHLFQYEQMDHFISFLEHRIGRDITLPRLNVSEDRPVTLDPQIEAKFKRKCAIQFDLWASAKR
jgi:hypothetical protein